MTGNFLKCLALSLVATFVFAASGCDNFKTQQDNGLGVSRAGVSPVADTGGGAEKTGDCCQKGKCTCADCKCCKACPRK